MSKIKCFAVFILKICGGSFAFSRNYYDPADYLDGTEYYANNTSTFSIFVFLLFSFLIFWFWDSRSEDTKDIVIMILQTIFAISIYILIGIEIYKYFFE